MAIDFSSFIKQIQNLFRRAINEQNLNLLEQLLKLDPKNMILDRDSLDELNAIPGETPEEKLSNRQKTIFKNIFSAQRLSVLSYEQLFELLRRSLSTQFGVDLVLQAVAIKLQKSITNNPSADALSRDEWDIVLMIYDLGKSRATSDSYDSLTTIKELYQKYHVAAKLSLPEMHKFYIDETIELYNTILESLLPKNVLGEHSTPQIDSDMVLGDEQAQDLFKQLRETIRESFSQFIENIFYDYVTDFLNMYVVCYHPSNTLPENFASTVIQQLKSFWETLKHDFIKNTSISNLSAVFQKRTQELIDGVQIVEHGSIDSLKNISKDKKRIKQLVSDIEITYKDSRIVVQVSPSVNSYTLFNMFKRIVYSLLHKFFTENEILIKSHILRFAKQNNMILQINLESQDVSPVYWFEDLITPELNELFLVDWSTKKLDEVLEFMKRISYEIHTLNKYQVAVLAPLFTREFFNIINKNNLRSKISNRPALRAIEVLQALPVFSSSVSMDDYLNQIERTINIDKIKFLFEQASQELSSLLRDEEQLASSDVDVDDLNESQPSQHPFDQESEQSTEILDLI